MSFLDRLRGREPGLDEARSLEGEVQALLEQGRHDRAVAASTRALSIRRSLLRPDDPELTAGLRALGTALFLAGKSREALPLFEESVRILDAVDGPPDPRLVGDTWLLAAVLQDIGGMEAAWPAFARWVDLVRTLHQGHHEMFPAVVHGLWQRFADSADHERAARLLGDNLPALETVLGAESAEISGFLQALAATLEAAGRYPEARGVAERHADLCRRIHGERSTEFIGSLGRLASVRRALRDYEDASALAQHMADLCAQTPGVGADLVAAAAWERAENELQMGRHDAAEAGFRRAIELLRKEPDPGPYLPRVLDGLAELYQRTGHLARALDALDEAYRLYAGLAGERSLECAQVLSSLANLRRANGELDEAERVMKDALAVLQETVGETHPAFGRALHDLGIVYDLTSRPAEARAAFEQALAIKRATLGEDHPLVASDLGSLGDLARRSGRVAEADALLTRAVEILRGTVHPANPKLLNATLGLAAVRVAGGRFEGAVQLMLQVLDGENEMFGQLFALSSEEQRLQLLAASTSLDGLLTLVTRRFPHDERTVRAAFDQVLRRKGLAAEALGAQRDALLSGRYPQLAEPLQALHGLRARIAQAALAGPGPEGPEIHARWLHEWMAELEEREIELARAVPELQVAAALRRVDAHAVAAALPAGSALLEFVQFEAREPGDPDGAEPRLLAFVLGAGNAGRVRMFDLGAAEPTGHLLERFRAAITGSATLRDLIPVDVPESADVHAGHELRTLVFDPLLGALEHCHRLFVSPDGVLNRLPFEILPLDGDRRLIDAYTISYLSAGRDAVRLGARAGASGAPMVLADPDFELAGVRTEAALTAGGATVRPELRGSGLRFSRLPGTRAEGERVAGLLGVAPIFGAAAIESRVKEARSPRVLHIATHGFFLPDRPGGDTADAPTGRLLRRIENPMVRSGLALAGANTWLAGGALPDGAEDAILNGQDVSGLDLTDTEMVVLSACETGLGVVQAGEGVFGLRRAFVLAGARTLIMSLWKVPDMQTQELMTDFYRRILDGTPRAEALRAAQLAIRTSFPEPLYWGAFICQGEPGPLGAPSPSDSTIDHRA